MAKKKTGQALKKAQWERGYDSHGYWLGKEKLGDVRQSPVNGKGKAKGAGAGEARYLWRAGNRTGESMTLIDAKRTVELLTEQGVRQLGLFDE